MRIADAVQWFAGGNPGYMSLVHCMNHDTLWISITVALDLAVALGYVLIALHWRRNERSLGESPAKDALANMKSIFIFCGLCGYLFIPIKMSWPAWRLYDVLLGVLVYLTWRYALGAGKLQIVYTELGRSVELAADLEDTTRRNVFLNAVSHDLKTPLNGLVLNAEVARMSLDSGDVEALREALDHITACSARSAGLLNQLLDLGRLDLEAGTPAAGEFPVRPLFDELEAQFGPAARARGLAFHVASPDGQTAHAERAAVFRILCFIVDNAVKFTEQGMVSVISEARPDGLALTVVDSGIGIGPELMPAIFDDFIQVDNRERDSRRGIGLGLGFARRLATRIGGRLSVESRLGGGSRFTLLLPVDALRAPNGRGRANRRTREFAPHAAPG